MFGNAAVSISMMNKSLTALRSELDDLKAQKTGASDCSEATDQPDTVPPSKWPRIEPMDTESDEEEDPISLHARPRE